MFVGSVCDATFGQFYTERSAAEEEVRMLVGTFWKDALVFQALSAFLQRDEHF